MRHQSQFGQDALIGDVLFKNKKGVFVDVGARDGEVISNTIYLEKACGWTGIAVEPHPDLFKRLQETRGCTCFNVAASDDFHEALDFVKFLEEPLGNSGLFSTFPDKRRLETIKHEIIPVPAWPLSKLIEDVKVIHYLDIDVEGHELTVLKGIDFSKVDIRIIGVEVTEDTPAQAAIDAFLANEGFRPFMQLVADRFYGYGEDVPSALRLAALAPGPLQNAGLEGPC